MEPNGILIGSWAAWAEDTFHAACEQNLSPEQCIASVNHECGIYSYRTVNGDGMYAPDLPRLEVLAEVVNWGIVHEYTNGYRAEWSRIERLTIIVGTHRLGEIETVVQSRTFLAYPGVTEVERTIALMEKRYGVPVEIVTRDELKERIRAKEQESWERLVARRRLSASPSQPAELSQALQNELLRLSENL